MTEKELFEFVDAKDNESEKISAPFYSYWKSVGRKFFSSKLAVAMLILLAFLLLMSFIQPLFSGYSVINSGKIDDFSLRYNYPNAKNWFGTDATGQSLFDAIWAGAKTSISIAVLATLINTFIGVIVGAIWGISKSVDKVMLEVYNVINNIPLILILLVFSYAFGSGFWNLLLAMCVTSWVGVAYTIRVQVMMYRDREYNIASKTLGTKAVTMISKNILPYLISVIVTIISGLLPNFISYEVFLSFLGVGLSADTPSLGRLIATYTDNITNHPYLFWFPVIVLGLVTISLYLVGQTLADASDPRTHQ
ncbi:peptide ABC transporter permease [Lactococcus hodotermopsidis]|uniref:Peptide ABC transporter permease n=1 Tax=Pseudolactococcus hodotermopsidis TaxID=2709157 RepID=A0A6A0BBP3_9LACT|nr:oligopeptide ABC transporter permease OppC [Lactococcus hodotermopsidis]GFH41838.1 peptide ABC transporter permease [Lactococcus hodotermopsidis]